MKISDLFVGAMLKLIGVSTVGLIVFTLLCDFTAIGPMVTYNVYSHVGTCGGLIIGLSVVLLVTVCPVIMAVEDRLEMKK